jgi:4-hydroxymandelate oxidase
MTLPITPEALEAAARELVSSAAWAYYSAGSFSEQSVKENVTSWSRWYLRNRIGVDTAHIDLGTTVLGTPIAFPVLTAPCGFNKFAHPDGEFAVARACEAEGTIQVLSSATALPPAEIAAVSNGPKWLQLYADVDTGVTDARVAAAEDAGFLAVAITVDTPQLGVRYQGLSDITAFLNELKSIGVDAPILSFTQSLDWDEIERIASKTKLPVVLKGVLHPDDARIATEHGVKGVIVSNHGGRQLDGTLPPALALPDVVEAAADRLEVYVDGGVRTGIDVLRALALGARAVLIGRPYLWALAVDGEEGVRELLGRFKAELNNAMALAGQTRAISVYPSIVVLGPQSARL